MKNNAVLELINHDIQGDQRVMYPTDMVGFFGRRTRLREAAESSVLESEDGMRLLKEYLSSFYHSGTEEDKDKYRAAQSALKAWAEGN